MRGRIRTVGPSCCREPQLGARWAMFMLRPWITRTFRVSTAAYKIADLVERFAVLVGQDTPSPVPDATPSPVPDATPVSYVVDKFACSHFLAISREQSSGRVFAASRQRCTCRSRFALPVRGLFWVRGFGGDTDQRPPTSQSKGSGWT